MNGHRIILASQSPRRKQLLEWAEVPFEVMVQSTDESYPPEMPVPEVPVHIAREKAIAIRQKFESLHDANNIIIAADTVVVLGNTIIGKPKDREDALDILSRLSGNKHQVITGVVLLKGRQEIAFADITDVWFHPLTKEQIAFYVDKYQPYDKAGAYAIQEWIGVVGIKCISGDFYNVMGLPVSRVVTELKKME
ncbi:septum formation protein Maf [Niastella koreensis]|uniref:dTTP/UTP pyrophosphatase n=2 Tax=Niastella koreensis TaxID=354356 RepID=G8T844_NIAKG|nr:Maf family protein [Niastella koreensis]AEV97995.1 Septum formation protein Maf [Niastella koreensis GR20-10]OQP40207.1 septum formation protein Maf [Niastella koreensis]